MRKFIFFILTFWSGFFLFNLRALATEEEDFYTASKAFSEGFYDASLKLFESFVDNYPQSSKREEAELFIGKSLYYKKDFDKASKVFLNLSQKGSSPQVISEALYWLGEIAFQAKRYPQALSFFNRLIEEFPDSSFFFWSKYSLGFCFLKQKDLESAQKIFEEILAKCKNEEVREKVFFSLAKIYYRKKNYFKLKELCSSWLEEFPQTLHKDYIYYYWGEVEYVLKNYSSAINYYKQALENINQESLRDDIRQSLGWSFLENGRILEAESYFSQIDSQELKTYSFGFLYYKKKEYGKAYTYFDKLIRDYPQSSLAMRAYLGKADCLYNLGRINDAISLYQALLRKEPEIEKKILEEIYYNLGWCYLKIAEYKKAIDTFKKLTTSPQEIVKISAQINIADVYQQVGNFRKAIQAYKKVLEDFPNNLYSDYIQFQIGLCLLKEKDFEASIISFENLFKSFPNSQFIPEVRYYLALAQSALGNLDISIEILQKLLKDTLINEKLLKEAYLLLLQNYIDKKNYQAASKVLGDVPKRLFQDLDFLEKIEIQKALLFADQGKYSLAKKSLESFLKKFPNSKFKDRVLFYLGNLYHKDEEYSKAKSYYQELIKNYPQSKYLAQARINLAQIFWSEKKFEEAEKLLRENIDSKNMVIQTKLLLIDFKISQEDFESALKICDTLIKEDPESSGFFYFKKAKIYQEEGDYLKAYQNFLKAKDSNFDSPELRFFLGFCLEKMGKLEEAIKSFFELVYLFPKEKEVVKAYLRIAKLYERLNKPQEAKKAYKKLIEMDVEEAKYAREKLKKLELSK